MLKRNLGGWLNNTPGDDLVVDVDGYKMPFHVCNSLLPPNDISEELVNYLTKVYNRRAIPSRIALPYGALTFSGNFQEFLKSLRLLMEDGKQPERIVYPFDQEIVTIGILIYPMKSQAVAYISLQSCQQKS